MATDKKVSQLDALSSLTGDDLFMVVNDPAGTPSSKKVTTTNVFGGVAVPANFSSNVTVTASTMTISSNCSVDNLVLSPSTPSTSNTQTESLPTGKIWFDHFYMYIAVSNTAIKRVALSEF